jgi:hypothetical protein
MLHSKPQDPEPDPDEGSGSKFFCKELGPNPDTHIKIRIRNPGLR